MRKLFFVVAMFVVCSMVLSAVPALAQEGAEPTPVWFSRMPRPEPPAVKFKIGFIVKTMDNPYYTRMRDGAVLAAEEYAAYLELEWNSAARQGDVEGQIRLMEDMIRKDKDLIILNPMGGVELISAIEQANEAGVPVIINDTRSEGGEFLTFVGFENRPAAAQMAEFLVDYYGGPGQAQAKIAILEGFRGHSTAEDRLVGYHDVLDGEPGMEVVTSMTGDWERSKGMALAEDFITSNPDLDLIIGSNDEMALGAVEAIVAAGKQDQIKTVGFDAICGALTEMLERDVMIATVDNHPDLQGYESVVAAYRYLVLNDTLPENIFVPGEIIRGDDPGLADLVEQRCAAKE